MTIHTIVRYVLKERSDLKGKVITLLTGLKMSGLNMTIMKYDLEVKTFGDEIEVSGPRTLQWNGKIERKFQTLYGRIRSKIN
jgi:hypothetical protein